MAFAMNCSPDLPLMRGLPRAALPTDEPLILASGSPRRAQLLAAAGYAFTVELASEQAECGVCSRETAPEMVARYAYRKAADVVARHPSGLVLAADTVASCLGQILGKPRDQAHAEAILRTLSGRRHDVFTGVCLWSAKYQKCLVDVVRTELEMQTLSEPMLQAYLESMLWEGKAGAFGYQDGNDWLSVVGPGSESNVVGLPMERLAELLEYFHAKAEIVTTRWIDPPLED
jgi:septum formation protein